jgi:hypothetical protein
MARHSQIDSGSLFITELQRRRELPIRYLKKNWLAFVTLGDG